MPAPIDVRCDFTPEALRAIADTKVERRWRAPASAIKDRLDHDER